MAVTDEDVAAKQERVARLREQVAAENAKRVSREQDLANEVTMKQLETEEARLEAELHVAKERNKATDVKDGSPLAQVSAELKNAQEASKATQAETKEK